MKVTIVGAGIGGLTLAIALQQKGIEVEIFEATPQFRKVGAGIVLAINAMQIYQRLGLVDPLKKAGNCLKSMAITDMNLKEMASNKLEYFEEKYQLSNVAIHRAALHEVLLSELPNTPLYLNKKLKKLEQVGEKVQLEFEDGTQHETDWVLGADGIHSSVRQAIFPTSKERFAKQICWRGVVEFELKKEDRAKLREAWGYGKRFGIVPIGNNLVYWFACVSYEQHQKELEGLELATIFGEFNPLVAQIIAATPSETMIKAELSDLEQLEKWHKGRVCLVGDAAHATTPNMGQGANQAIESAWVLSECLAKEKERSKAFEQYQKIRQTKANQIIKTSWQIGKVAHISNPFLAGLRNTFMRLTPAFLGDLQLKKLFKLDY
ncbi:FAD-dependent monooxygenase [Aureispira anguillae]|uniref:FAD-dependent monooxygenase n=1 Tax=Aureispira anguillae TaxID=2864201 RepID=A0A915YLF2_9BACT|nr:FAD-dependent monooxygenase [Aureispira anguillae]BDS15392.1 FAD-dependent monooxygenase [Aureispira anguillae]